MVQGVTLALHHFTDRETEAQSVQSPAQVLMKSREASEDDREVLNHSKDGFPSLSSDLARF